MANVGVKYVGTGSRVIATVIHLDRDEVGSLEKVRNHLSESSSMRPEFESLSRVPHWLETVVCTGCGVGVIVLTGRAADEVDVGEVLERGASVVRLLDPAPRGGVPSERRDDGPALAHPAFFYENAEDMEFMITRQRDADAQGDGQSLRRIDLILKVAELAENLGGSVRFLHTPAAAPECDDGDGRPEGTEAWRPARRDVIRGSVAVRKYGADHPRPRFWRELRAICSAAGSGLYVADHRRDRRRGEWFEIQPMSEHRFSDAGACVLDEPACSSTVTFIAWDRVGLAAAILREIHQLEIEIGSASITVLQGHVLLHFQLLATGSSCHTRLRTCEDHLRGVASERGWQIVVSDGFDLEPAAPVEDRSLWASWRTPFWPGCMRDIVRSLHAAVEHALSRFNSLTGEDASVNVGIDYLISRGTERGDLRGRCKLAVAGADQASAQTLNEVCRLIESRWRMGLSHSVKIAGDRGPATEVRRVEPTEEVRRAERAELAVAWNEAWLGRAPGA